MKYQRVPMLPANLEETVARYNSFVESGVDADFDKPTPRHRIEKPPFYAAWATPVVHDTRAGLRINAACHVVDMNGEVIPGLYCGGESAGGFSQHGLARAACQGYIAGRAAAPPRYLEAKRPCRPSFGGADAIEIVVGHRELTTLQLSGTAHLMSVPGPPGCG